MPENAQVMTEIQDFQKQNTDTRPEAQAEQAGLAAELAEKERSAAAGESLSLLKQTLEHVENQMFSGAPNLTPKDVLLDLSDLAAKHPEMHFRWVNIRAPGKADRRRLDGYIRLPASEGGRELGGEIAVFVTSKKIHESRVQRIKDLNKARLKAHRAEVENAVEAIAKELRDKYGLKVDPGRILVDEE